MTFAPEHQGSGLATEALAAVITSLFADHGMTPIRQTPLPVLNVAYHANSFSYWLARMIASFVVGTQAIGPGEAEAWLDEFEQLDQKREYFFCSTPILTEATKAAETN